MKVTPKLIGDAALSQADVDQMMNELLVNPQYFSEISCMWSRTFGVKTRCDDCTIDLNWCVRKEIVRELIAANNLAERKLGFELTPRYRRRRFNWRGEPLLHLDYGLESINKKLQFSDVTGSPFAVNQFVEEGITPIEDPGGFVLPSIHLDMQIRTESSFTMIT